MASPLNLLTILWLIFGSFILDLSNFFNKAVLNIPSDHWLLIVRINILFFVGIVNSIELYNYIMTKHSEKKLSPGIVIIHLIILFEITLFCNNFPKGFFSNVTSIYTKLFWSIVVGFIGILFVYTISNKRKKLQKIEL